MRLRVTFFDAELTIAAVHCRPNWLERLFGVREFDARAEMHAGIWAWELTSHMPRIAAVIVDEIERAAVRAVVGRRLQSLTRTDAPRFN